MLRQGYFVMSTVVYGMVVSIGEMVAVYPYCRGTVALADRFVDPALGFAMGWNAWYVARYCFVYLRFLIRVVLKVSLGNCDPFSNCSRYGSHQVLEPSRSLVSPRLPGP